MANLQDKRKMAKEEIIDWLRANLTEAIAFFAKSVVWVWWVVLSVVAKVGYVFYKGQKLTNIQILSQIGMSLFVGYVSFKLSMRYFPDKGSIIVPVCTLGSEKIVGLVLSLSTKDWRALLETILRIPPKKE